MARTEAVHDLRIVLGTLIRVVDDQADGRTRGPALEHPRQDLHLVRLAPLRGMPRLSWLAAIQVVLQIGRREFQARRAAVDNAAERRPMALAKGGDGEQLADGVSGHGGYCSRYRPQRRGQAVNTWATPRAAGTPGPLVGPGFNHAEETPVDSTG